MLTVNETANEPPPEDGTIDSAKNLGVEAVLINHIFAQQVLRMVCVRFFMQNKETVWLKFIFRMKNVINFPIRIHLFNLMKKVKLHPLLIVIVLGI